MPLTFSEGPEVGRKSWDAFQHFRESLTPGEIALLSAGLGGVAGLGQGLLLFEDPKWIAAKALGGALSTAALGYGLAKAKPYLGEYGLKTVSASQSGFAEGYFEQLIND